VKAHEDKTKAERRERMGQRATVCTVVQEAIDKMTQPQPPTARPDQAAASLMGIVYPLDINVTDI